jgi:hypothetical protein
MGPDITVRAISGRGTEVVVLGVSWILLGGEGRLKREK